MYLKEIIINGFKSFPEKTVIKINSEFTAVVGPNGSGKSNISDAFKWVMGEQSAKTLRGSKMEDVIFAGTERRKPLGYAEVNLVFDNSDKRLPIYYQEVCITRRLFRTGESDYLLNKTSTRLKEIRELFMDTGIGIDGYSIIGQGRVEDIVGAKSETRRKVIEEAAGIVKFKTRKDESIRKLSKTEENIERVNDIILEIEQRIEPLRKQKESAEKYLELKNTLKSGELNLLSRDYDIQNEFFENIKEQLKSKIEELKKKEEKLESSRHKFEKLISENKSLDEEISNDELEYSGFNKRYLENESTLMLHKEKRLLFESENEKIKNTLKNSTERIHEWSEEIDRCKNEVVKVKSEIDINRKILLEKEGELESYIEKSNSIQKAIEMKKNDIFTMYNIQTETKSKINIADSLILNLENRYESLETEYSTAEESEKRIFENITESNEFHEINMAKKKKLAEEVQKTVSETKDLKFKKNESDKELVRIKNSLNEIESKKKIMSRMQESYDGYYKSVQRFMIDCKNNNVFNRIIIGVVAELVEADKSYETALQVALGSSVQNILIESERNASEIISYLKKRNMGRITFLPIDTIKPRKLNTRELNELKSKGCIGVFSDLVNYENKYKNIIEYLLGRVILTDNIENGIKIAKSINYSAKIVTISGEIVNAGGSITGGTIKNRINLVGRKREINELEDLASQAFKEGKDESDRNNNISDKILELDSRNENSRISLNKVDADIKNSILETKYLKEELERIQTGKIKLEEDFEFLKIERKNYLLEKDKRIHEMDVYKDKIQYIEKELEESNSSYKNSVEGLESRRIGITDYKIKISELMNSKENVLIKAENFENRIIAEKSTANNSKDLFEKNNDQLRNLDSDAFTTGESNKILAHKVKSLDMKLSETRELKKKNQELQYGIQKSINEDTKLIGELGIENNSIKAKVENTENKIAFISNQMWEDYEMSYAMCCEYKDESISMTKLKEKVRKSKKAIKSLGDINIGSIEEYNTVSERYEFLVKQRDDLDKAKEKLNRVINELTYKMKKQFGEEFGKIREQFKLVFVSLFNGGKADIVMSDESDLLNSNIEIYAQPPGKKLNKISLMSGGEKAMTAIALLFSILRINPTPFCILDEIEAALDDANVYRFAAYLKDFSKDTQFLVITHRKGTMEFVDTLYGTTMEEQGVTKLVSMKLSNYNI
jgi:chromosome segregation protein